MLYNYTITHTVTDFVESGKAEAASEADLEQMIRNQLRMGVFSADLQDYYDKSNDITFVFSECEPSEDTLPEMLDLKNNLFDVQGIAIDRTTNAVYVVGHNHTTTKPVYFVAKFNEKDEQVWLKNLAYSPDGISKKKSAQIVCYPDGSACVGLGWYHASGDALTVFKLDNDGNTVWSTAIAQIGGVYLLTMGLDTTDNLYMVVEEWSSGVPQKIMEQFTPDGVAMMQKKLTTTPSLHSVVELNNYPDITVGSLKMSDTKKTVEAAVNGLGELETPTVPLFEIREVFRPQTAN